MPSEIAVDLGASGMPWDTQAIGQHGGELMLGTSGAGVRGGVVLAAGGPLSYVANGGLTGVLVAGRYNMPLLNASYGAVPLVLPSNVILTHDTANGAQPRTDLIIAEVGIGGTGGTFARFRIVKGVAAAGAPIPTTNWPAPGGAGVDLGVGSWQVLSTVRVPAGATSLQSSNIFNFSNWSIAAGGVMPLPGAFSDFPNDTADLPPHTPVWDPTNKRLMFRDGGTGLVHPIPAGMQRDVGEWTSTITVPAGAEYDSGSLTLTGFSYSPSVTAAGSSLYLPSNSVCAVNVVCEMSGGLDNTDFRLVRSDSVATRRTLAKTRSVGVGTEWSMSNPCVYASVDPVIGVLIRNNSGVSKEFRTRINVAVTQRL